MLRFHSILCSAVLAGLFLMAFTPPANASNAPNGYLVSPLGSIAAGGAFAPDPQVKMIALDRDGLFLVDLAEQTEKRLSEKSPLELAWSADGSQLAAVFASEEQELSRLVFFDREGKESGLVKVPGRVTKLVWDSAGELLGQAVTSHKFTFGTNLKASLFRLDSKRQLVSIPLYETTLKPSTVDKFGESLYQMLSFDLAPLGDEIVYTRLSDPPVLRKHLQVFSKHLKTGKERQVFDLPLESGASFWVHNSEWLLLSDGSARTFLYDPWQGEVMQTWPVPGQSVALSPQGDLIYIDGTLYRYGEELMAVPSGRAKFSYDGQHLLVADQQNLVVIDLPAIDVAEPLESSIRDELLRLRELRSDNLLTHEKYLDARQKLTATK